LIAVVSWRNSIHPAGIIIHHSATRYYATIQAIGSAHESRGFGTFYWGKTYYIGYHYIILGDGTVLATRPEHLRGAHARGYNSYIGICLIGNFSSKENLHGEKGLRKPTATQMRSLYDLCNQIRRRYGFPLSQIRRHSDVNKDTECPGDRFPYQDFIASLSERSNDIALTKSGAARKQSHPSEVDRGQQGNGR
jgi:N-acetylmuramoyl-L-alanine amidase